MGRAGGASAGLRVMPVHTPSMGPAANPSAPSPRLSGVQHGAHIPRQQVPVKTGECIHDPQGPTEGPSTGPPQPSVHVSRCSGRARGRPRGAHVLPRRSLPWIATRRDGCLEGPGREGPLPLPPSAVRARLRPPGTRQPPRRSCDIAVSQPEPREALGMGLWEPLQEPSRPLRTKRPPLVPSDSRVGPLGAQCLGMTPQGAAGGGPSASSPTCLTVRKRTRVRDPEGASRSPSPGQPPAHPGSSC